MPSHQLLKLINIHYKMGSYSLFSSLEATFTIGSIVGLVGANGSGKSTLLRILSGLCLPHAGSVCLDHINIYQNPGLLKQQLGFVPATPFLYPHLTVLENLTVVAKLRNISQQHFGKQCQIVLRQCDLMGYQKVLFGKLSDGLKKRAGIASQLLHEPTVLILDEPCAQLDPQQRQQLWDLLPLWRRPDRLILFSSHHPQEMMNLCNTLYLLKEGALELQLQKDNFAQTLWQRLASTPDLVST